MSQEIKFQFRFSQCKDESENLSQVQPNDSSQSNDQAGHESSEIPDGPDNSSQTSSQTTDSGQPLSENSQETPQNSRETPQNTQSQKCVISPFVNLKRLNPAELGITLEDFEQLSDEILNKSFRPDEISSQSSQDEKE